MTTIPGPSGNPVLGMGPAFRRDLLGTLLQGFHRHGELVTYRFGPRRTPLQWVMVGAYGPDGVRQVLTGTERAFGRQTVGTEVLTEVFGRGLFTTEGEAWRCQRRTLQPMFTPQRIAGYRDMIAEEADRVVSGVPDGVVDLHQLMLRYTLRVLGRALFGREVDGIAPRLHHLVPLLSDVGFTRGSQLVRPPLSWPTPRNRRLVQLRAQLHTLVDQLLDRDGADRPDDGFVTRLRAASDPGTGQPFSEQEIRDQVLLFLIAGHETTAAAATFTLDLLGRHPGVQDQVASEPDPAPARAALMEGMRLFPPAYLHMRVARTDIDIAGHLVPRGTHVFVSPWVTHRHPEFWPDPERFDPHRFIGDHGRPRYAYFPFGGGPRSCIGEQLALTETTTLLRTLLARYRIEPVAAPPRIAPRLTLRPAGPVLAKLIARRRAGSSNAEAASRCPHVAPASVTIH
jgi:cytochrome P450